MFHSLYVCLSCLSFPLIWAWMRYRILCEKEDSERINERYGQSTRERPQGTLFWFHGASIGECLSFMSVLNHFEQNNPDYSFLVTSGTRGSADLLKKKLSSRSVHQYVPLDHPIFVRRFLDHWKPDACFWTESDLWPNIIVRTSKICPMFLLNGRLSETSAARWRWAPLMMRRMLTSFKEIFPQSFEDSRRFRAFHIMNVKMMGNLKYEGERLEVSLSEVHKLKKQLRERSLWIASNTHAGEEEIILDIHQNLQKELGKQLLLILIPRHQHRYPVIQKLLEDRNLSHMKRTDKKKIPEGLDVFVVDTLGELGIFYSLSPFVFMAGSLLPEIGGHNVLEPARLGCLPIFGPYMKNNQEMAMMLLKNKAAVQIKSPRDLEKTVKRLLLNERETKEWAHKAASILKNISIVGPVLEAIKKHLP